MITFETLQGHWERQWIKAPGFEDHTTRVHWMQVGALFADVRIPQDRPDVSEAASLSALPAPVLYQLSQAEGFAGHVTLLADTCTWHREVNFHGIPEEKDVGRISFDPQGNMIEAGVHAEYTELWTHHRAPQSICLRLSGEGFEGVFAAVGETFVLGLDRPGKPSTASLRAGLEAGEVTGATPTLFEGIYATGRWQGDEATAYLATNPFCEGRVIFSKRDEYAIWHGLAFDGTRTDVALHAEPVAP
ncbi:MAG: hypothetical protein AAF744_01930 [Pseudomonadota bacterium]